MTDLGSSELAFNPSWSSAYSVDAFLPSSPHKRKQRAWERQPRPARDPQKQSRRIWKRHDAHVTSHTKRNPESVAVSPVKAVKKLRIVNEEEAVVNFREKHGVVAKYDRRKSRLPHKIRPEVISENPQNVAEESPEHAHFSAAVADENFEACQEVQTAYLGTEDVEEKSCIASQHGVETTDGLSNTASLEDLREAFSPSAAVEIPKSQTLRMELIDEEESQINKEPSDLSANFDEAKNSRSELDPERDIVPQTVDIAPEVSAPPAVFALDDSIEDMNIPVPAGPDIDADADLFDVSPVKPLSTSARRSPRKITKNVSPIKLPHLCIDAASVDVRRLMSGRSSLSEGDTDDKRPAFEDDEEYGAAFEIVDASEAADSDTGSQSPDSNIDGNETQTIDMKFASYEPTIENTVTTTMVDLNDDTEFINNFLSRAKASKAAKIAKRSSLSHKRDSDAIRLALASPRRALEDIDVNSPSPRKISEATVDDRISSSESSVLHAASSQPPTPTRRSLRTTMQSRSRTGSDAPNSISLRRGDGSDCLVIKKTETQELAQLTRNNTRRNKGGAVAVSVMLKKLAKIPDLEVEENNPNGDGKMVRWNEQLVDYFSKSTDLQDDDGVGKPPADQVPTARARARRVKALGAVNGTPARKSASIEGPDAKDIKEVKEVKKIRVPRRIPTPSKPVQMISEKADNGEIDVAGAVAKPTELKVTEPNRIRRRSIIPTRSRGLPRV